MAKDPTNPTEGGADLAAENADLKAKLAKIEKDDATVADLVKAGLTEAQARQKLGFQAIVDEQVAKEAADRKATRR